jgi:hypothetical protein
MALGQDSLLIRRCSLSMVAPLSSMFYYAFHPWDGYWALEGLHLFRDTFSSPCREKMTVKLLLSHCCHFVSNTKIYTFKALSEDIIRVKNSQVRLD